MVVMPLRVVRINLATLPCIWRNGLAAGSTVKKFINTQLPRIAIAGITIESSTFSPAGYS